MKTENKNCQNCKTDFTIEPEDFTFYEKIKVPPPTFCPECRLRRRFAWRNERFLYRRPDARTGDVIFSAFAPTAPIKTVAQEHWSSDDWDPREYGRDYDFSRPFFEQFRELMQVVPWPSRWAVNIVNADYNINTNDAKDCYLVMSSSYVQNSSYCIWVVNTDDSIDLYNTAKTSWSYNSSFLRECSRVFFSMRCDQCQNVWFSRDMVGCWDCFGCAGLRNKKYCIFNQQLTKEEYSEKIEQLWAGSYQAISELRARAHALWATVPVKYMTGRQNVGVTGEYIDHSKNVRQSYNVQGGEDLRFCQNILKGPARDCYDYSNWGENAELIYDSLLCGVNVTGCKFSVYCWSNNRNLEYCINGQNLADSFGCVSLKSKQYCILNKQYSKEEYFALRDKIIQHMKNMPYKDKLGNIYAYGEFFPMEFAVMPYNETIAQEFFPITKEEAERSGYLWNNDVVKSHEVTLLAHDLPDHIKDVNDSILHEVVGCAHRGKCADGCMTAFKITKSEFSFYKKFLLPIPRLCFNCRHAERLALRNPINLWSRTCQCAGNVAEYGGYKNNTNHFHGVEPCPNEFETAYCPDSPEIVYCESCYNSEVV
jgi:hypothetical protein